MTRVNASTREHILELKAAGLSPRKIADEVGLSHITVRRVLKPKYGYYYKPAHAQAAVYHVDDTNAIRFTDYPDSITAAIMGDPTPQRRAWLAGGRV